MTTLRSQDEIRNTAVRLGLPEHPFFIRRTARALDLVDTNKVNYVTDDIFRVHSQYDEKYYTVELDSGLPPRCTCADFQKHGSLDGEGNGMSCKHIIASLYLREKERQAKQAKQMRIKKRPDGVFCWIDGNTVGNADYNSKTGHWYCGCMRFQIKEPCKHVREIQRRLGKFDTATPAEGNDGNGGNGSKITNECGSNEAQQLQNKLNGQLNKSGNNGNGDAKSPSLTGGLSTQITTQLDITDPFQESEQNDIDQIEGRRNGELAWKLSNGEYVISYAGVMKLAEKHDIDFPTILRDNKAVIAYAQTNGSMRLSGKPVRTYDTPIETVCELAKRNAARQLLPLPEIKAVEHKAKLNAEFDWQKAKAKCVELVGIEANVDIIIHELTQAGKLRQDNPSHYDRTEWLIIHSACKQDASSDNNDLSACYAQADGGDNPPSSLLADGTAANDDEWKAKLKECEDAAANEVRYCFLRSDLEREGTISNEHPSEWQDRDFETLRKACALDASLFNRGIGDDWTLIIEPNKGVFAYERRYRFWLLTADTNELREKCFVCRRRFITNHNHGKTRSQAQMTDDLIHWERYYIKTVVCADCLEATTKQDLTKRFNELYHNGNGAVNTDGLPKPSEDFLRKIDDVLNKRRGNATPSEQAPSWSTTEGRRPELPQTADDFVNECKEVTDSVTDDDTVEANEMPLENDNGKRKLQMDKKLRTWLIDIDGTKKEISCREICEQFESKKNPRLVTRLRAGIDSGADISTVELDD